MPGVTQTHLIYKAWPKGSVYSASVRQQLDGSWRFISPYPNPKATIYKTKAGALARLKKYGKVVEYNMKTRMVS